MKRFLGSIALLFVPAFSYAEPPQITVAKDGTTVVKSGSNTVTVLPDGTLKVQSPVLNLTIGGDKEPLPPQPPAPHKPSAFQKLYDDEDLDPAAKQAALALIVRAISETKEKADSFKSTGELNSFVKDKFGMMPRMLTAIRSAIGYEFAQFSPEDEQLTADRKKKLVEFLTDLLNRLNAIR